MEKNWGDTPSATLIETNTKTLSQEMLMCKMKAVNLICIFFFYK